MTARRATLLETTQRQPEVPPSSGQRGVPYSSRQLWLQTQKEVSAPRMPEIHREPTLGPTSSDSGSFGVQIPPPHLFLPRMIPALPTVDGSGTPIYPLPPLVAPSAAYQFVASTSSRATTTKTTQLESEVQRLREQQAAQVAYNAAQAAYNAAQTTYAAEIHAIQQAQQRQMFQYMQDFTAAQLQGLSAPPMPTAIPLPQPPQPPQQHPQQPLEADINLDNLDFV
ncbi:hypothetical protein ACLB2K_022183 [Fragaria x ananassa]